MFTKWLPLNARDAFLVERGRATAKVWFDMSCLDHVSPIDPDDVHRHINLRVGTVGIDIELRDVNSDLSQFVYQERKRPQTAAQETPTDEEYSRLSEQYGELGRDVLRTATEVFNRLVDYFRVEKGQYWLQRYEVVEANQASFFVHTDAKVRSGQYDWVRWCPPPHAHYVTASLGDRSRFVSQQDWSEAAQFVQTKKRPDLVLELLSNAERLLDQGYGRSALIEAVAALEHCLFEFIGHPDTSKLEQGVIERIQLKTLKTISKKLGLRGSLSILVPILLSEKHVPRDLLDNCVDAVVKRGSLVHGTPSRVIASQSVGKYLRAIRSLCLTLSGCKQDVESGA